MDARFRAAVLGGPPSVSAASGGPPSVAAAEEGPANAPASRFAGLCRSDGPSAPAACPVPCTRHPFAHLSLRIRCGIFRARVVAMRLPCRCIGRAALRGGRRVGPANAPASRGSAASGKTLRSRRMWRRRPRRRVLHPDIKIFHPCQIFGFFVNTLMKRGNYSSGNR